MKIDNRDDFIDLVAQAVIDKIEERDRVVGLVNMVVQRVVELQQEEAALKAAQSETPKEDGDGGTQGDE